MTLLRIIDVGIESQKIWLLRERKIKSNDHLIYHLITKSPAIAYRARHVAENTYIRRPDLTTIKLVYKLISRHFFFCFIRIEFNQYKINHRSANELELVIEIIANERQARRTMKKRYFIRDRAQRAAHKYCSLSTITHLVRNNTL